MKKTIFCLALAVMMLLAAIPAYAANSTYSANSIYRAALLGSTYTKLANSPSVSLQCDSISYSNETSETKLYHYARIYSTDQNFYSSYKRIPKGPTTTISFSSTTALVNASTYKIKLRNAYYYELSDGSHKMSVSGKVFS